MLSDADYQTLAGFRYALREFVRYSEAAAEQAGLTPRQHQALLATEGVTLTFTEEAVDAIADAAVRVNGAVENIGARRLQTVLEKVLEEVSFSAADRTGETVTVDAAYVHDRVGALSGDTDLSRFIL